MKISVLGAGAVGSMIGGWLQRAAPEHEVMLIARGEHARVLAERGSIALDGIWPRMEIPIKSSTNAADVAGSDFVFVTVKSQATEEAIQSVQPYLGKATVVSIQNGINEHVLTRHVPPEKLVMGMAALSVVVAEPGLVRVLLGGPTLLGPGLHQTPGPQIDAAVALLQKIDAPSLKFLYHPQVLGVRYNKLAINALGFASSLSNSNFITEALGNGPWAEQVGLPLIAECGRVFEAASGGEQ